MITSSIQSPLAESPRAIVNYCSAGSASLAFTAAGKASGKQTLSGALTADTYAAILTVSTPGVLNICLAYTNDTTERTVGLKITIDGVDVFDAVSASYTAADYGIIGVGVIENGTAAFGVAPVPTPFKTLVVSVKSNVVGGESDKITLVTDYRTI
jgi:uncharacterized protein YaiE (UPF0345 family)